MSNIKITLEAARVNAGLTQEDVKRQIGIARSTLNRWENGKTTPSEKNRKKLCELYSITEEQIRW